MIKLEDDKTNVDFKTVLADLMQYKNDELMRKTFHMMVLKHSNLFITFSSLGEIQILDKDEEFVQWDNIKKYTKDIRTATQNIEFW